MVAGGQTQCVLSHAISRETNRFPILLTMSRMTMRTKTKTFSILLITSRMTLTTVMMTMRISDKGRHEDKDRGGTPTVGEGISTSTIVISDSIY